MPPPEEWCFPAAGYGAIVRAMNGFRRFLPPVNSPGYHVLLAAVAIFILGPLGGITAAYMNFSLGFFVGGQVLAGILGSVVTYGYGKEGKHGANYIQTMAASVAGLSGMAVLIQAMVWLGLPEPPVWQMVLYFMCIGMFGVGVGMLYTPILVDRMQLSFPSGFAVANILRALTDIRLLRESIAKLGGGALAGLGSGLAVSMTLPGTAGAALLRFASTGYSASTLGAGMIVGARIGVPAIVVGGIGVALTPWLRTHGMHDASGVMTPFLGAHDPFRKIALHLRARHDHGRGDRGHVGARGIRHQAVRPEQGGRRRKRTGSAPTSASSPAGWRSGRSASSPWGSACCTCPRRSS